jgi:hypothetical protein
VHQECNGPTIPETLLEYPESSVACSGNARPATVTHAVQLGITCGNGTFFTDAAFECDAVSHKFDLLNDYGTFTCMESATLQAGSNQSIPRVAVVTDDRFVKDAYTDCFTVATLPPSTQPPSRGLPVPTAGLPAPFTETAPLSAPMITPQVVLPRSDAIDGTFRVGLAIGGAAVAVVFAGVVVVLVMRRRGPRQNSNEHEIEATSSYDEVDDTPDIRPIASSHPQPIAPITPKYSAMPSLPSGKNSSPQNSAVGYHPTNGADLEYKDQARSSREAKRARQMPLVAATVEPASLDIGSSETSAGTPVAKILDVGSIAGVGGNAGRSNSIKRRAIDP